MKNVLILCTGNSCRSQIAEGYLSAFAGNKAQVYSAGIETHGVNPRAVKTMMEDGIDISKQTSDNVNEYKDIHFDYIITVCDNAKENCPYFPSDAKRFHQNFPDPAKVDTRLEACTEEEIDSAFAEVRQMIKQYIRAFADRYIL